MNRHMCRQGSHSRWWVYSKVNRTEVPEEYRYNGGHKCIRTSPPR